MKCLRENTSKVVNIRQYLLTVLYNAPLTISNYYSALVQHDMYGKARDADVMTAAFKEYTGKSLNKTKKPSVRAKLKDAITQAKDKNREREKTKQKEKEPTL